MTFEEYRALAQRTDANTTDRDRAINGAIGLYGEVNELLHTPDTGSAENVKETGDILWYLAAIATALHINLDDAHDSAAALTMADVMTISLEWRATVIGEFIKKAVFQGHTVDAEALAYVTYSIGLVIRWLEGYAAHNDFTLNAAMRLNIDKLKERYPNGFEAERSMHRPEYEGNIAQNAATADKVYTAEDIKQARRIGYRNGLKRGADQHARYALASMALALHEMGYPKNRILRMIANAKDVAGRYSTANGNELLLDAEERTGIEFIIR